MVLFFLITGLLAIRRVHDPFVSMTKSLEKIIGGDLSQEITLKPKDEFQNVAETLNDMLRKKREEFRRFSEGCHKLSKGLVESGVAHRQGGETAAHRAKLILEVEKLRSKGAFSG